MDFKRIFRTPVFWVLAVVVVMLTVFSFDGDGGYTTITTAQAEKLIAEKKVESAVMTTENVLTLDLREGQTFSDEATDVSGATRVRADYRAACLSLGAPVRVELPGGAIHTGIAEDVDTDGRLLLLDPAGHRRAVAAGDVVHLRSS